MVRIDILIREDQEEDLGKIPGTNSELIRQAIDEFIKKRLNSATLSPSGKGVSHGSE